MTVIVFGRKGCYACVGTVKQLAKWAIPHRYHDVDEDLTARQTVEQSGKTTLPLVHVVENGDVVDRWHGLRPERIRKLVK